MAEKNVSFAAAVRATLVGGAVFLIPGFLAVFVLSKVFKALRALAMELGSRLGISGWIGGVLVDLAVIAAIILVCLLAGLLARRASASGMRNKLDQILLASFPGYAFIKNLAENMQRSEEMGSSFVPVLMRLDDSWQVAFETGRLEAGIVAVYVPGAPNPWSGSVAFVTEDRVSKLPVSINEAIKINRALGKGSEVFAAQFGTLR